MGKVNIEAQGQLTEKREDFLELAIGNIREVHLFHSLLELDGIQRATAVVIYYLELALEPMEAHPSTGFQLHLDLPDQKSGGGIHFSNKFVPLKYSIKRRGGCVSRAERSETTEDLIPSNCARFEESPAAGESRPSGEKYL